MPDSLPETKFQIFSGMLKAASDEEDQKSITTTASSSVVDAAGHEITKNAIDGMAASAKGMTIFLNHSYKVPEDVFGVVRDTKTAQRGEIWDLDFAIDVEMDNPRAVATYKSVRRGVKLGTSIGCLIKDAWKNQEGNLVIDDVNLLEASIVGIPSNPRTWVQYATKAMEETLGEPFDATAEAEDQADEPDEAAANETESEGGDAPDDSSVTKDVQPESEPPAAVTPPAAQEGQPTDPESAIETDGATPETKAVEPIPASSLEATDDPLGDAAKGLLSMKEADFNSLLKMVETTTHEMVETKKALFEARTQVADLERERDEAKANVVLAQQFVDRLSQLPIGRRASHAAVIGEFNSKLSGIYDPDFIKMLTTGEENG